MAGPYYEMTAYNEVDVSARPHDHLLYPSHPKKPHISTSAYPVPDYQQPLYPHPPTTSAAAAPHETFESMASADLKTKSRIRALKFLLRLSTFLLASADLAAMLYMLATFYATRHVLRAVGGETRGPWPPETVLWPTVVLAAVAALTFVASVVVLGTYCCGVKAANAASSWSGYVVLAAHAAAWVSAAVAYRVGKSGSDLWGWSCEPAAEEIQGSFEGVVDFARLCKLQGGSWDTSIANAVVVMLTGLVYWLAYRRLVHQRKMHGLYGDRYEHKENWVKRLVPFGKKR